MPTFTTQSVTSSTPAQVDVRGPRFAAWITTAVLVAVLALSTVSAVAAGLLLAVQAVVFAIGAARRPAVRARTGSVFRPVRRAAAGTDREREPAAPPQFAQLVGLLFAVVGAAGLLPALPVARRRRHRLRALRRPAQRGLRLLPRLRALPDSWPACAVRPACAQPDLRTTDPSVRRKGNP